MTGGERKTGVIERFLTDYFKIIGKRIVSIAVVDTAVTLLLDGVVDDHMHRAVAYSIFVLAIFAIRLANRRRLERYKSLESNEFVFFLMLLLVFGFSLVNKGVKLHFYCSECDTYLASKGFTFFSMFFILSFIPLVEFILSKLIARDSTE